MLQFDFAGERLFQHRNFAKWKLGDFCLGMQEGRNGGKVVGYGDVHYEAVRAANKHIVGFRLEKECMQFVAELRERWTPGLPPGTRRFRAEKADAALKAVAESLCSGAWWYGRAGLEGRKMVFLPDGSIGDGAAGCERVWTVRAIQDAECAMQDAQAWELQVFGEHGLTLKARLEGDGMWRGAWVVFGKGPVEFRRVKMQGGNGANGRAAVGKMQGMAAGAAFTV
jgi:hypothetical protein